MISKDLNIGNLVGRSGLRERRFAIRYPIGANADILDLKSGSCLSGVTSDLSLGGCFVCARRSLEIGTRVRLNLERRDQKVTMIALVRVVKPKTGMGIEFLDVDPKSSRTLFGLGSDVSANHTDLSNIVLLLSPPVVLNRFSRGSPSDVTPFEDEGYSDFNSGFMRTDERSGLSFARD